MFNPSYTNTDLECILMFRAYDQNAKHTNILAP